LDGKIFFTQEKLIYKFGKKNIKKVNKFDDKISACKSFENVLVAGDTRGNVKVIGSKNIVLRSYNEHQDKINDFALYKNKILITCSNDGSIKFFDIRKEKSIKQITNFGDYVRCCKINGDILYCGTMDNFIYSICLEKYEIIEKFNVDNPVYKIDLIYESKLVFTSSNKVYTLDLNKKSIQEIIALSKEITHLSIQDNNICTTSLDGFFRTWSFSGMLISQINLYSPILSAFINSENIFFGLENGELTKINFEEEKEEKPDENIVNPRIKAFEKQIRQDLIKNDLLKSNKVESLIRNHAHVEALRICLDDYDIQNIYAVLYHLQNENKLTNCLTYIDKTYIYILLDFIIENFFVVDFFDLFFECLTQITSIYLQEFYNEDDLMEKIDILRNLVDQETYFQEKVIETVSFYECFDTEMGES
jgi:WD40 repeat protein